LYRLHVDQDQPLVRELFPELVAELIACLREEGETDLAISAWDIRLHSWCGCNDDFCQSFYTAEPPDGAYGSGHRCVPLLPRNGDLILDVVKKRIMFVEVLYYPKLRTSST
jgi:hypothetical protein